MYVYYFTLFTHFPARSENSIILSPNYKSRDPQKIYIFLKPLRTEYSKLSLIFYFLSLFSCRKLWRTSDSSLLLSHGLISSVEIERSWRTQRARQVTNKVDVGTSYCKFRVGNIDSSSNGVQSVPNNTKVFSSTVLLIAQSINSPQ